jgi:hypothetical protein
MANMLEQCIGTGSAWLRTLLGGTFLCTAECDAPGPCCEARRYPGDNGPHSCGTLNSPASFCVTEYRQREVVSSESTVRTNDGASFYAQSTTATEWLLNGANYGLGTCSVGFAVPIRESYIHEWLRRGVGTSGDTSEERGGDGGAIERCVQVRGECWPVGSYRVGPFESFPFWQGVPFVGDSRNYDETTVDPRDGSITRTIQQASIEWTSDGRTLTVEWSLERTITTSYTSPGGGSSNSRTHLAVTGRVTGHSGWSVNCDGTNGPQGCAPVVTECEPDLISFIVGVPCGAAPRPFVLPVGNVFRCGYVLHAGVCYQFSPNGRRIRDPVALNAIVGTQLVNQYSPQTCCDCQPACPKVDLVSRPEWLCGQRDGLTGVWATYQPFVAGRCCCFPGDRFKVRTGYTTYTERDGGNVTYSERLDMVPETSGEIDPATGNPYPNPIAGFRRDVGSVRYSQLYVDSLGGSNPQSGRYQFTGPVDCEYIGFGAAGGASVWSLSTPLDWDGNHLRVFRLQPPANSNANGEANGWRLMRYALSATCTGMTVDALWHQLRDDGNIYSVDAHLVLDITRQGTGDCAGECVQDNTPPAGSTPFPFDAQEPDLRRLIGGL